MFFYYTEALLVYNLPLVSENLYFEILKIFFFLNVLSLLGNFSLLDKKLFQSFLSLSEILSVNYVNVLTSCQLGFNEVVSLEKTHVS